MGRSKGLSRDEQTALQETRRVGGGRDALRVGLAAGPVEQRRQLAEDRKCAGNHHVVRMAQGPGRLMENVGATRTGDIEWQWDD